MDGRLRCSALLSSPPHINSSTVLRLLRLPVEEACDKHTIRIMMRMSMMRMRMGMRMMDDGDFQYDDGDEDDGGVDHVDGDGG